MASEQTPDQMHYDQLQQEAMRGVVRAALKRAAAPAGLPGEHHFYISFRTDAPGVSGPKALLGQYPEGMTIVLQNQYWDLAPGETFFSVTLRFGGQPQSLSIPYAAITRFEDPSVRFRLEFTPPEHLREAPAPAAEIAVKPDKAVAIKSAKSGGGEEPKVVSLDQFRKK